MLSSVDDESLLKDTLASWWKFEAVWKVPPTKNQMVENWAFSSEK